MKKTIFFLAVFGLAVFGIVRFLPIIARGAITSPASPAFTPPTSTAYYAYATTLPLLPPVFSPRTMLDFLWENYKKTYLATSSGETFDPERNDVTTSEAQSYALLRAVWMDDQTTFNASWQWTKTHLQRPNDHLFSWLYGTHANGTTGVLVEQGGQNTASDADSDIALALVFAYSRWMDDAYLRDALPIISDIWNKEVFTVAGKSYFSAYNLDAGLPSHVVNPSYLAPYTYRIFAQIDRQHDWQALVDSSYAVLQGSMQLSKQNDGTGLPPEWVQIDPAGAVAETGNAADLDYSFNALRVPWRIALDFAWYHDARAQHILQNLSFLKTEWDNHGLLYETYATNGSPVSNRQSPAMYGGALGYFVTVDPADAQTIYREKLQALYNPDIQNWNGKLGYYDANIAWFGMALYEHALPNLFVLNNP